MAALTALIVTSIAMSAAGTATSVYGAKRSGKAAKAAANAEADMQEYNAKVAELQAEDASQRGDIQASRYKEQIRAVVGRQRTAYGAQGVDVASGTPLAVQADTTAIGEMDALQLKSNAAREAWGYKVEAYDSKLRAYYARREGVMLAGAANTNAWAAGLSGAGGVLGGAANLYALRYGFQSPRSYKTAGTGTSMYQGDTLVGTRPGDPA